MPLIALRCPHCNGAVELDDTNSFGFCQYCGTKVLVADVTSPASPVSGASGDVANLIKLAEQTLESTDSEVADVANRILALDADNPYGWYYRGVSAAMRGDTEGMYNAWCKALEHSTTPDFENLRGGMVDYAVAATVNAYDCDETVTSAVPCEFIYRYDSLIGEEDDRFAYMVLNAILDDASLLTPSNVIVVPTNTELLARAEMQTYADLRQAGQIAEFALQIKDFVTDVDSDLIAIDDDTSEKCIDSYAYPYEQFVEIFSQHSEEDFDRAAVYWGEHDTAECTDIFDEAIELSYELAEKGVLGSMGVRKAITAKVREMAERYFATDE